MNEEQFNKLITVLENIDSSLKYVGNILEDASRFNNESLNNLINSANKQKRN